MIASRQSRLKPSLATVLGTLALLGASAASAGDHFAYVANRADDSVSVINTQIAVARVSDSSEAQAPPTCNFNPSTHLLVAKAAPTVDPADFAIQREGEEIQVLRFKLQGSEKIPCEGGTPTVTTTDRIEVLTSGHLSASDLDIDLRNGRFAPGATAEPTGSSEIEFVTKGRGEVVVSGGDGADHFRYMSAKGKTGLNLNPGGGDRDVDVVFAKVNDLMFVQIRGRKGPDRIDVTDTTFVRVDAAGGPGNDTLRAGSGALYTNFDGNSGSDRIEATGNAKGIDLNGGVGNDTLLARLGGQAGSDITFLRGQEGADRIYVAGNTSKSTLYAEGGAGNDRIYATGNGSERIAFCGRGHDLVVNSDLFSSLISCEEKR